MTTFDALSARRRKYIEAARDNGFEEGLRKLLADLYPDNAHFIYELLQNAEDAGANEVYFDLQTDGLRVDHDGARPFDLGDIESITGIGQSTKADDATRIGKFGVGFKAVFAYTRTPVIHSGAHSFEIQDLFVPRRVPVQSRDGWTTFWLPFDRAEKPASRALKEVATALREISGTTLLFLNNIRLIACSLPGEERLLERRALDEHLIEIESVHEQESLSYWYRVTGEVTVEGESHTVAAAFALESAPPNQPERAEYAVKPINGQVFIYFPAIKETSGLKFHVHAPFASTVARDSVRDDAGNDALVQGMAGLLASSLPAMRDYGLVTDGLLSALPNDDDVLPERYDVLRDRITSAFSTDSLAPVAGGGHAPARTLLKADVSVRSALSVDDVNLLRGLFVDVPYELAVGWLLERSGRARGFLNSLDAQKFGRDEVTSALSRAAELYENARLDTNNHVHIDNEDPTDLASWVAWISSKSDDWLRRFYVMLNTLTLKSGIYSRIVDRPREELLCCLRAAPLVRVQDGKGVRHVPGPSAHLPTAPQLRFDGLVADDLAVFDMAEDSEDDDELRAFYKHAGVKLWDAAAQLDAKFSKYSEEPAAVTDQHMDDLKTLTLLINDRAVSPSTYASWPILVATRRDGNPYWATPGDVYLDEPFLSTGLASLYGSDAYPGTPRGRLDERYLDSLPEFASLAKSLGVADGLYVAEARVRANREFRAAWAERENRNTVSFDWDIPHFDLIITSGDEALLRELWRLVSSAPSNYAEAVYRSNGSSRTHAMQSQLLQKLLTKPWILDLDGNLRRPEDITAEELAEDLRLPTNAPLLEQSGFGRRAAADAQGLKADAEVAKRYGFESPEDMQWISALRNRNPEKFTAALRDMEAELRLPYGPTSAPEQRTKRAEELSADAPVRRYDKRVRSVYVQEPGHLSAARGYLKHFYTNDDGVMVCQVCTSAMPFKIGSEYYFEAVQFVKDATRDFRENRLALCPNCAAKYRHATDTTQEDLRDDLLTQGIGFQGSITVDVLLAGEAAKVRFVGKHAIDLQAALLATGGEPIDDDEFDE